MSTSKQKIKCKEHLRCVVWPRGETEAEVSDGKGKGKKKTKVYRYLIAGMLVTDAPIKKLDSKALKKAHPHKISEVILDGPTEGLVNVLCHHSLKHKYPKWPIGEIGNWLCCMNLNIENDS